MSDSPLRRLPSVSSLLTLATIQAEIARKGHEKVVATIRETLEKARKLILGGASTECSLATLEDAVVTQLNENKSGLRAVLNATGILLHTGLGRAPLAQEVIAAVTEVASGYCNLELDLETGKRGSRTSGISSTLREITGAEAATVVNNNAAATILALRAVALGREVVVSRGELVEIGGSFRLPDIFEVSGAKLREVGTTNRTRLSDFERAINPETAAMMRIHASNYRIEGFTESVGIRELASLGKARGVVTIDDIGSGAINELSPPCSFDEPTVAESLASGADLVLFSGDKLLGGPQCGMIVGRADLISRINADPLYRAVRIDKMTLAALSATLDLLASPESAARTIPLWRFMTTPLPVLAERSEKLAERIRGATSLNVEAVPSSSFVGGGSLPRQELASMAVRLGPPWPTNVGSEEYLARFLRLGRPSVMTRVQSKAVWLDLRGIEPHDDDRLAEAILSAVAAPGGTTLS